MGNYKVLCVLLPVIMLAMCQAESHSARLTASSNPQNSASKKNVQGRTRECKEDLECGGIQNTTCMTDPRDRKMRCLCRDSSAPINGACPNLPRAVGKPCSAELPCTDNAECRIPPNATTTSKICLCKDGYSEQDGWCSGALKQQLPTLLLTASLLLSWMSHRN